MSLSNPVLVKLLDLDRLYIDHCVLFVVAIDNHGIINAILQLFGNITKHVLRCYHCGLFAVLMLFIVLLWISLS